MKSKAVIYFILVILINFLSCQDTQNEDYQILGSFFKDNNTDIFLVIPVDIGCETCIEKSIEFIKDKHPKKYKVILAGANQKQNKIFFNKHGLSENDFLKLDEKHILFKNELIFTNPIIYQFKNKILKKKVELVPNNIHQELLNLKLQ